MDNINEITRLASGSIIKGDVFSNADIRIDGAVVGSVCSNGKLVLGEKAVVVGDVIAPCIDVWGNVKGSLYASDSISLKATSKVNGDLNFCKVQIEIGADFVGACKKLSKDDYMSQLNSHRIADPKSEITEGNEA